MKTVLREPLLHFGLLAAALFGLLQLINGDVAGKPDSREIKVDREELLTFIQYRAKFFQPEMAELRLAKLSSEERSRLEKDYIEQEALYREALGLGMDRDDYIIKQRLVQKIRFLAQGFSERTVSVSEEDVQQFFAANREDYYIEPSITFTHVFLNAEQRGWEQAEFIAKQLLVELNARKVPFQQAVNYGDRFLYHLNYVERTPEFVTSHFGVEFSQAVFAGKTPIQQWTGPLRSSYGLHLLLVAQRESGRDADLMEVRPRVEQDARREAMQGELDTAIASIVAGYTIEREPLED